MSIKTLTRSMKIAALKATARSAYSEWQGLFSDMSCGASLGLAIRGGKRNNELVDKFNAAMDELAKLDPKAPATRLSYE